MVGNGIEGFVQAFTVCKIKRNPNPATFPVKLVNHILDALLRLKNFGYFFQLIVGMVKKTEIGICTKKTKNEIIAFDAHRHGEVSRPVIIDYYFFVDLNTAR